jgi:site-specific recombinase XerC
LLNRRVGNCSGATLRTYAYQLQRFLHVTGNCPVAEITMMAAQRFLASLRERVKPISVHQAFRVLRTFFGWCVDAGLNQAHPMRGLRMQVPKVLPRVPEDDDVRRLLAACPDTFEGRRNRALIALAADSGLRKEELRRLRIGDLDFTRRMIRVHAGKGWKDGVTFFGETASSLLRAWLAVHPNPQPFSFVCCIREGIQLGPSALVRILHRLSVRAGLAQKIGPHALRHYAATAVWRRSGDVALVQRLLRHTTLTMSLCYIAVSQADIAEKFQHVSPMDHLQVRRR